MDARRLAGRIAGLGFALATVVSAGAAPAGATTLAPVIREPAEPPALDERMPPLPRPGAFTWQRGRWAWTGIAGTEWQWEPGRYVEWPRGATSSLIDPAAAAPDGPARVDDDWP